MRSQTRGAVATIVAVAVIIAIGMALYSLADIDNASTWYVQVDNDSIVQQGERDYDYTLEAYDDSGTQKELTFGTERKLRDGAFLKVGEMPLRGVVSWEEVQLNDIPQSARDAAGWAAA